MLALVTAASAAAPRVNALSPGRSPIVAIQDDRLPYASDPAARIRMLADAGAALIRVDLRWDTVARARPANPTDPADPAYDWHQYDAIVAAAATYNVEVLFAVYGTPAWAADTSVRTLPDYIEGRFPDASFRPREATDFGAFGEAVARRYAPLGVEKWEGWNEPNIGLYLQPQYNLVNGKWAYASPAIYSALLKAFYAGVKRADPTAVVAGAVTAPAGDLGTTYPVSTPPQRIRPQDFIPALNASGLQPPMDVVSHHPYPLSAPRALTLPGRGFVDLYNLGTLVKAIDATYLSGKSLWLTEYGFATRTTEEYTTFFSPAQQASYIVDAYWRTRANPRVALTSYFLLQDHPNWASGVLTQAGGAKPGYQAIGIPFATANGATSFATGSRVTLVGQARLARTNRTVEIQRRSGNRWVRLAKVATAADGSFRLRVRLSGPLALRAKWTGAAPSGRTTTRTSPPVNLTTRR